MSPLLLILILVYTRKYSTKSIFFLEIQLIQRHYSAKKRQPIKHGLSYFIIGKFSLLRAWSFYEASATSLMLVVSIACCTIFVFYVTLSPCRPSAIFLVWHAISKSGTVKIILLLRGKA